MYSASWTTYLIIWERFWNNVGWLNLFTKRKDLRGFTNEAANSFQGCVYSSLGCAPTEKGWGKDGHDRGLSLDLIEYQSRVSGDTVDLWHGTQEQREDFHLSHCSEVRHWKGTQPTFCSKRPTVFGVAHIVLLSVSGMHLHSSAVTEGFSLCVLDCEMKCRGTAWKEHLMYRCVERNKRRKDRDSWDRKERRDIKGWTYLPRSSFIAENHKRSKKGREG